MNLAARTLRPTQTGEVSTQASRSIALADFLELAKGTARVESFEEARRFYVGYHALLCEVGLYSCAAILLSASRVLLNPVSRMRKPISGELVIFDGSAASGLRTITDLGLEPLLDIRPRYFLSHLSPIIRWRLVSELARAVDSPERFFERLFDAYACVTEHVLERHPGCSSVMAANERSLGCAPVLAATRFLHARRTTVVQHGNPVADFLPTLADEYWCRSDRWFEYLKQHSLVPKLKRITDFPLLHGVEYSPRCRRALLVLHNVGYLEPNLDYPELTARISSACARAGWTLHALKHPANPETYGLPVIDRTSVFEAALAIGFRSTATDQVPREMPRVSLLDYWPDFFLRQGTKEQVDDYLSRIREALT